MNCCLCLVVLLFHTCVTMCCRLRGVIDTTVRLLVYVGEQATTVEGKKEGGGAACLCVCRVCVLLYLSSRLWSLVTPCSFAKPTIWDAGIDRANRSRAHKIERERERERQGWGRHVQFSLPTFALWNWTSITICTGFRFSVINEWWKLKLFPFNVRYRYSSIFRLSWQNTESFPQLDVEEHTENIKRMNNSQLHNSISIKNSPYKGFLFFHHGQHWLSISTW